MASGCTKVTVTPETATIEVGQTVTLQADIEGPCAGTTITWSSNAETVATVTQAGVVTGVAVGTATITAALVEDGVEDTALITVVAPTVNVPNVVASSQANASAAIISAGLAVGTITQQSSATVPTGNVISQNPAAGASVAAGTAVNLVISTGPQMATVPNVVNTPQANAAAALTAAGLTVGTTTQQSSATIAAGNVISQNPGAGAVVTAGTAVNLVISTGVQLVTVPNVVGMTQANASTAILGVVLVVGSVTQETSLTVPAGTVISQNPASGASVAVGSAVNLVVSSGPPVDFSAVRVTPAFGDPSSRGAAGWAATAPFVAETTGNPSHGGHGQTGTSTPDVTIKAAYDATNLYMYFQWADGTANERGRVRVYDTETSSWSVAAADEDRLYLMWPIIDGVGREGKTFNEIGCAMTCHALSTADPTTLVPEDPATPVEDCRTCHLSPGDVIGRTPPFEHVLTFGIACTLCHGDYSLPPADGLSDGAEMVAPAGLAFDIWHWKANRSNPNGLADDNVTANARLRSNDGSGVTSNNVDGSRPKYVWADGTSGDELIFRTMVNANSDRLAVWNPTTTQYENLATAAPYTPYDGQRISLYVLRDDLLGSADASFSIGADGMHDGSKWTVVLTRALTSADPLKDINGMMVKTDADFVTTAPVKFSLTVTNNTGLDHQSAGLLTMGFLP
jgi:beta-lactam-binding protein with PASTA domain